MNKMMILTAVTAFGLVAGAQAQAQISGPALLLYRQMQNLTVEGTVQLYQTDPKAPGFSGVSPGPDFDEWTKRYRTFSSRQFKLELKNGSGTITYYPQSNGTPLVIFPASVWIDNREQGQLAVRVTLGLPHGGKYSEYAYRFLEGNLSMPDDPLR
jgi:hypothetical protein